MHFIDRRRFLQSSSLALAAGYSRALFAAESPKFAEQPSFDPQALFLTWQRDPTTTMTIQWIGREEEGAGRPIWFARTGADDWAQQAGSVHDFPMTNKKVFRTELTGLAPDTEYRFRVGTDSAEQRFRTMPAKATNPIHFVSGGDAGVNVHTEATNRLAAAQEPQFVVLGGDLAYENGRSPGTFYQFLSLYSRGLRHEKRLIPLLACIGNHEVNGSYEQGRDAAPFFYSVFDGLFTDTSYGCLDFGDYLSLVFLDTNHNAPVAGAQTDWLSQTLKQREHMPTVFCFDHVPTYPSVRPVNFDDLDVGTGADNRKHWSPLFERYNVDAVFEHHDHAYKRTHPMLDGHIDKRGVLYLGDGSWGRLRRPATPEQRPFLAVSHEAYHLSVHRIEGEQRSHVALTDTGRVVDVCVTTKKSRLRAS